MIAYFTLLLVGEHCSHMTINRTLEHKVMMYLLIVNALYPNVAL